MWAAPKCLLPNRKETCILRKKANRAGQCHIRLAAEPGDRRGKHHATSRREGLKKGSSEWIQQWGFDNVWATATHFSLKCHIFDICYCYQQQGACFTWTDFSRASLFHLPKGTAGDPQFRYALSEMEDASNMHLWGTKHLALLSMVPGEAGYKGKWDRASRVETTDCGATRTKTIAHTDIFWQL